MPPTLASLVQHLALKLTVRAGEDRLETPVRWAHVSELADPVPYMEGGELLLVTAMTFDAEDREAMRRYVRRLVGAGVVGLGFAVGVYYEDIPCSSRPPGEGGLLLLEVPRRTPFLAISKAVSAAIAADQYRAVTAGFEVQRELTRAALTEGPGVRRHAARRAHRRMGGAVRHLRRGRPGAGRLTGALSGSARLTGLTSRLQADHRARLPAPRGRARPLARLSGCPSALAQSVAPLG